MAETHVLSALKRRYGEVRWLAEAGADRTADLAHLAAVILMFNPAEDLAAIAPVRRNRNHKGRSKRIWIETALDVLRAASEPLTTRQIARRVAQVRGAPPEALTSIECSIQVTLDKLDGVVRSGSPKL